MRLPSLLRRTPFRLTLLFLALFVAAAKQAGRPSSLLFVRTPQGTSPVPLKFAAGE